MYIYFCRKCGNPFTVRKRLWEAPYCRDCGSKLCWTTEDYLGKEMVVCLSCGVAFSNSEHCILCYNDELVRLNNYVVIQLEDIL